MQQEQENIAKENIAKEESENEGGEEEEVFNDEAPVSED